MRMCTKASSRDISVLGTMYVLLVGSSLFGGLTVAQTQDSALAPQQAKLMERLHELEQEIQQLKQQITAIQTPVTSQPPVTPAPAPPAGPPPVAAGGQGPSDESQPAPLGTIDVYGFAMLDAGGNFGQIDPNWYDTMRLTQLPSFANQFAPDGTAFFSVRQTRFGVKTSNPTRYGVFRTIFEFELFGTGVDQGQTAFRLRQAYGELGRFGGGQYWSAFMDPDVFPNALEYWGPTGAVSFRNLQARFMPIKNDRAQLTFTVEQPGATGDQGIYASRIELANIKPKFDMPDFGVQGRILRDWGHVQVAAIFRKISWVDTTNDPTFTLGDTVLGWGVNTSAVLRVTQKDTARLEVVYGKGIENYMNDAPVDVAAQNNFSNPLRPIVGKPLPIVGVVAFLDHDWSKRFSTSAGYSMANIDNTNGELPSDYHQGHYALANLLYHPVPKITVGGEFQFGRRLNFSDGFNVNAEKVQFSLKFEFNKAFAY